MTSQQELKLAAQRLLHNQDLTLVLTALKKSYIDQIVASSPDDVNQREAAYFAHNAVTAVSNWIKHYGAS